jgi:hypothetical protein
MLNRHLDRILADLPVQFNHKGIFYGPAGVTRGPVTENQQLMAGGLDLKLDSNLYVKAEIMGTVEIRIGDPIAIRHETDDGAVDSVPLKVHDIKKSADNAQLLTITLAWARR